MGSQLERVLGSFRSSSSSCIGPSAEISLVDIDEWLKGVGNTTTTTNNNNY